MGPALVLVGVLVLTVLVPRAGSLRALVAASGLGAVFVALGLLLPFLGL